MWRFARFFNGTPKPSPITNDTPEPSHIANVPDNVIAEIFIFVVHSSEEARYHAVEALCRVQKLWNRIANKTPDLWTMVTFAHPRHSDKLSASLKRLKASEPRIIDVEIDFCKRSLHGPGVIDPPHMLAALLRGSEHRMRSISIKSNVNNFVYDFLEIWTTPIPDKTLAAATPFQNLRKLEINSQAARRHPTIEQISAIVATSPGLEILDVSGFYSTILVALPQIQLPALKSLVLGRAKLGAACQFLSTLQTSETLEAFSLVNIKTGRRFWKKLGSGRCFDTYIARTICEGPAGFGPKILKDPRPSEPQISKLGLRSLSLSWDVDEGVFVSTVRPVKIRSLKSLWGVYIRRIRRKGGYGTATGDTIVGCIWGARVTIICKKFAGDVDGFTPDGLKAQLAEQDSDRPRLVRPISYDPVSSDSVPSLLFT